MRSRSLFRQVAYLISVGGLGLGLFERLIALMNIAPCVKKFADEWARLLKEATERGLAIVHSWSGPELSEPYHALAPVWIELFLVILFAFANFGFEPYWTRARRAKPDKALWPRYAINLTACIVLVVLLVAVSTNTPMTGFLHPDKVHEALANFSVLTHPVTSLDYIAVSSFAVMIAILIGWHPGAASRVLVVIGFVWVVSTLSMLAGPQFSAAACMG